MAVLLTEICRNCQHAVDAILARVVRTRIRNWNKRNFVILFLDIHSFGNENGRAFMRQSRIHDFSQSASGKATTPEATNKFWVVHNLLLQLRPMNSMVHRHSKAPTLSTQVALFSQGLLSQSSGSTTTHNKNNSENIFGFVCPLYSTRDPTVTFTNRTFPKSQEGQVIFCFGSPNRTRKPKLRCFLSIFPLSGGEIIWFFFFLFERKIYHHS